MPLMGDMTAHARERTRPISLKEEGRRRRVKENERKR